jgi:hypothetical protein
MVVDAGSTHGHPIGAIDLTDYRRILEHRKAEHRQAGFQAVDAQNGSG